MTLQPFKYAPADSLQAAETLLREHGDKAAVIAGGTDLLGGLKDAIHDEYPELLIGLKPLADLRHITVEPAAVRIGALATLDEIARNTTIRQAFPLLAEAARSVASPQIRNVATIAGNLCQEPRCWYYRYPDNTYDCLRKGGKTCDALFAENRYHSIFGAMCVSAAPCVSGCPIHNDIPAYMEQIRAGRVAEAAEILVRTNPLAAITGRVCAHYCEADCNRYPFDEPVSIRGVERFLGDYALEHAAACYMAPETESGKRVAIVGAGPAGLTAAYFLRMAGHGVTVYDRMPEAGGMLMYSIPAYRLPKSVVAAQVRALEGMGIRFALGAAVGAAMGGDGRSLQDLQEHHDSVFLATGLWSGRSLRMERGELLDNGLEFLINVQRGATPRVGARVLVIGGGSVAADVAITARRLGARQVTMACLECEEEMPAVPEDVEQVLEEGLRIMNSWGPHRILEQDGRLVGMEMVRCTSVFDEAGRFAPAFDGEVKTVIEVDQVFVAIGQAADLSYAGLGMKTERGFIVTEARTAATSLEGVFAGGDVTGGSLTVVHAMADGRSAAASIDAYLAGAQPEPAPVSRARLAVNPDALLVSDRAETPRRAVPQRTLWDEDGATLGQEVMAGEAVRCANCGCVAVNASDIAPALIALDARVKTTRRTLAAEDLFTAAESRTTVLAPDELIEEIEIPAPPPGSRQHYLKFRTRNAIDFPIVSLAFCAGVRDGRFHGAKVVLGAVAPVPFRVAEVEALVEGREPGEALAAEAGTLAVRNAQPLVRNKLKVEVVKALLRKAILAS